MEIYNYVCKDCGSKQYRKEGNEYICLYCGSREVVNFDNNEKHFPKINHSNYDEDGQSNTKEKNKDEDKEEIQGLFKAILKIIFNRKLFRLIVCVLFGVFGAHKFLDGKFVLGFVYIFTLGIFLIGYIVDVVIFAIDYIREIILRIQNLCKVTK